MSDAGSVISPFDPSKSGMKQDPYTTFAYLRENEPIHKSAAGYWVVSRHEDVHKVLMDRSGFGQGDFVENVQTYYGDPNFDVLSHPAYCFLGDMFLMQDPPRHTRIRGLVVGALNARRVAAMETRIREIANSLIDDFINDGEADLLTQFAYKLPVQVMCEMLGINTADKVVLPLIKAIEQSFIVFEPRPLTPEELKLASEQVQLLTNFFSSEFADREVNPRDDLLTSLAQAGSKENALSTAERIAAAIGLFGAGFETTAHMISNAMLCFKKFPDQWELLCSHPSKYAPNAVEETLRFESSLIATYRSALEEREFHGQIIKPGEKVVSLVGAGNRDPRIHKDPDTFNLTREHFTHSSFGGGIHFCVGAQLARTEGAIAFEQLAKRMPDLQVKDSAPAWREGFVFRGVSKQPVRWTL